MTTTRIGKTTRKGDLSVGPLLQQELVVGVEQEDAERPVQQPFLDVLVQVTVLLGVRPDAGVVLVDEDAHLRQELHLPLVEAAGVHLGHRCGGAGPSREAQASEIGRAHV